MTQSKQAVKSPGFSGLTKKNLCSYLSNEEDVKVVAEGLKQLYKLKDTKAFKVR